MPNLIFYLERERETQRERHRERHRERERERERERDNELLKVKSIFMLFKQHFTEKTVAGMLEPDSELKYSE